ncbi:QcrA and Rieske domain-containing protein [Aureibacter tunicatorum]|uniref:Menaquinol-cytochrome c reductase iron-sulfur subunit n=1 Tax=Aureibacter tunicatorum TaxID=866807 RepID=A0AAE3XJ37_9BACT|nr:Rieske 2Fe-2S domain-containing protein [Aureibacter tunicatorum]MDR6237074.1 menaquinol-cytochrome c reductase iron-sulfur subunit [Aureibacter tunicatorum]BDD06066.1 hypothetical protein AUTU_35490 [Aureibacter tunicatorum]
MSECKRDNKELGRRSFLTKLSFWLGGISAGIVTIPVIGALLQPLIKRKKQVWRSVGKNNDFEVGKTVLVTFEDSDPDEWAKTISRTASWLRKDNENEYTAFAINCAHLGCPVRWEANSELFLCPCHGGVYYKDGSVASGPPPKPLTRYMVRLNKGNVEIMTQALPITTLKDG